MAAAHDKKVPADRVQARTGEPRVELDASIVRRAQAGHRGATRQLVMAYQRPVFSLLWRLLAPAGREAMVEDLAQETFLRVFRALATFDVDGPAQLSTWVLTIATRIGIDELRRNRPELRTLDRVARAAGPSLERQVAARDEARRVEQAMAELTSDQRAVLVLSVYFDLGHDDIAAAVGCEVGTVKSRLSRARRRLRELTGWGGPQ